MSKKLVISKDEVIKAIRRKGGRSKELIANILEVIDEINTTLPKRVDAIIAKKLDKMPAKDFVRFVGRELLDIYMEAGGRKALIKHFKSNPEKLFELLLSINTIFSKLDTTDRKAEGSAATKDKGVVIQFIGMDKPSAIDVTPIDKEEVEKEKLEML